VLAEQLGVEADVARSVDAVDVAIAGVSNLTSRIKTASAYPKPAAIEKNLEMGRKACSLRGDQYVANIVVGGRHTFARCPRA
jgi:hypothetical protein